MKLKGEYNGSTTYSIGDVVRYTDGVVYVMHKAAAAGTTPVDTAYWTRANDLVQVCAGFVIDMDAMNDASGEQHPLANNLTTTVKGKGLDARQGKALKDLIDALDARVTALEPETEPAEESDT